MIINESKNLERFSKDYKNSGWLKIDSDIYDQKSLRKIFKIIPLDALTFLLNLFAV